MYTYEYVNISTFISYHRHRIPISGMSSVIALALYMYTFIYTYIYIYTYI